MGIPGKRIKPPGQTQAERDKIALGRIEAYMDSVVSGQQVCPSCNKEFPFKDMSPAAAQLLRSRYDKLRPSLSAVEQTFVDERDRESDQQVMDKLRSLVVANAPALRLLLAESDAKQQVAQTAH